MSIDFIPPEKRLATLPRTPRARQAIARANRLARDIGMEYLNNEHLFLGSLDSEDDGPVREALRRAGTSLEAVREATMMVLRESNLPDPNGFDRYEAVQGDIWRHERI